MARQPELGNDKFIPGRDPSNPFDAASVASARFGAFFYALATGLGVGAFLQVPYAGAVAGAVLGLVIARWLVPALMRDWH